MSMYKNIKQCKAGSFIMNSYLDRITYVFFNYMSHISLRVISKVQSLKLSPTHLHKHVANHRKSLMRFFSVVIVNDTNCNRQALLVEALYSPHLPKAQRNISSF